MIHRPIRLQTQDGYRNACGQACIAMIAGVSMEEAIQAVGTAGGTNTPDLIRGLRTLGIPCASGYTRISWRNPKPNFCIVRTHCDVCSTTHWVVWDGQQYYDPSPGFGCYPELLSGMRETSFLEIYEGEER